MATWTIEVEHPGESESLSGFLIDHIPGVPRQRMTRLVSGGAVSIDGEKAANPGARVHPGTKVTLELDRQGDRKAFGKRGPKGYRPLYFDEDVIVVDKFWNLLSVPRFDDDTLPNLVDRVAADFDLDTADVRAVHRLDRYTSGVMVLAINPDTTPQLIEQFRKHTAKRVYRAIAKGRVEPRDEPLVHWLRKDDTTHHQVVAREGEPGSTEARLRYEVTYATDRFSVLRIELETGLQNQIRVQLADIGHPLMGERVYANAKTGGLTRQALHAAELGFTHPRGGSIRVTAELAPDLQRWLAAQESSSEVSP